MPRHSIFLISLIAGISLCGYLLARRLTYATGFPLDDAWIHQTYARNLVQAGEWAFLPGVPSAGSTSPAWTLALAAGYWLNLNHLVWAFFLGWGLLAGISLTGTRSMGWLLGGGEKWGIWAGCLLALEWHLVWAAASGMETLAFALIILLVLVLPVRFEREETDPNIGAARYWQWLGLGVLVGLGVWIRPDGISLLAALGFTILLGKYRPGLKLRIVLLVVVGFLILFIPYLWFNHSLSGSLWPNTLFAKQAEYASLREAPFLQRYLVQARLPLVGVGVMLLPGFVWMAVQSVFQRRVAVLAGVLWVIGYLGIFAWRMPVIYQHGRYVIPTMAVFCIWGFAGLLELWQKAKLSRWPKLLARAWAVATGIVLILFWGLGARAYAQDVAVIESEMVATARWVNDNLPGDAFIAAHDIGALGYFGGRSILDLAGLVSPEVIPFIRDEPALGNYLDAQEAEYLITFPGWYPYLTSRASLIYSTDGVFSPQLGGENMTIYQWGDR
jgi:hypothetical protein